MAFFKFRNRGAQGSETHNTNATAAPAESVEAMRKGAKHRLIGAAVLVLLGVIGFPLLFDTQPRPVPNDIPIEIPDRAKTKLAPARPKPAAATASRTGKDAAPAASTRETREPSSTMAETTGNSQSGSAPSTPRPEPAAPEARPEPHKPEPRAGAQTQAPKPNDGARARALLDNQPTAKPAASEGAGRFIVQIGAFTDASKAREVRRKLEKAGIKTYTQVAKTADGDRTRVRIGPFSSRADAEKAASRAKGLSLPASVLSL